MAAVSRASRRGSWSGLRRPAAPPRRRPRRPAGSPARGGPADRAVGQVDHQLVDGATGAPLEDVDADDLAPHRPDPAGDLPQRTGAVGQPHADDVGLHGRGTYGRRVNSVFRRGTGRRTAEPDVLDRSVKWSTVRARGTTADATRQGPARPADGLRRRRASPSRATTPRRSARSCRASASARASSTGTSTRRSSCSSRSCKEAQTDLRRRQQQAIGDEDDPVRRIELGLRASMAWAEAHRDHNKLIQFAATEAHLRAVRCDAARTSRSPTSSST